jgi:VPDSG-CTERM motif
MQFLWTKIITKKLSSVATLSELTKKQLFPAKASNYLNNSRSNYRAKVSKTMKLKLITALILASVTIASANLIPLGSVTFSGDFTLNHLYDFNNPASQPFGWWGDQTVTQSSGIFSPNIQSGNVLGGQALRTVNNLPLFTLGGFTFVTTDVGIFGPDSGRFVQGIVDLSGNGFPGADRVTWQFTAPPYDITHFDQDITGPITLMFLAFHETGHVPDTGATLTLLAVGLVLLFGCRRLRMV